MRDMQVIAMAAKRLPRAAALLLAFVCALLCVDCKTDIQSGVESANDLLYNKQYVAAERLYHKLLKRLGEEGELSEKEEGQRLLILDRLGKVNALYLHDYAQAIHFYQKLVQLYPRTEPAFAARAMIADIYHHKLGNLEAAISEYQKLVAEFPEKSETRWAQLQIAGAFFQLKDYEQARTEAEALTTRWPNSSEAAQARFQIANSYYVQGRYADATATYERLLEGNPDPSLASLVLFELGNCFQELGDLDRALAYYYACLADHPNPLLVQRKIRRVRTRMNHVRPAEDIQLPEYVLRRLAVAQGSADGQAGNGGEGAAAPAPRQRESARGAPETNVFKGSHFDENETAVRPAAPAPPPQPSNSNPIPGSGTDSGSPSSVPAKDVTSP